MSTQNVVSRWLDAFKSKDLESVEQLLAEDLVVKATNLPNPLTKPQWLGFIKTLMNAFPDIQFNWRTECVENGSADLVYQLTGTHTAKLALSGMGMKDFEPTKKSFSLPEDTYSMTLVGDKISRIDIDPKAGAGLGGILVQLGLS
ncbi:MAG: nuclear transport factor 2 family protein [Chloroflexi bacterium]|nr:nuclear transport factor 2 family protein [Chloroflexota bacterium]